MTLQELSDYGIHHMDDDEVEQFLSSHNLGVLGLPTTEAPYLLPMSYGYDGGERLYFFFIVGSESRKSELATGADSASFLVYSIETMFNWRSVSLRGTMEELRDETRAELTDSQMPSWRPDLFETASRIEQTQVYEFRIEEWTGLSHSGLPPTFFGSEELD